LQWRTGRVKTPVMLERSYLSEEAKYKVINGEAEGRFSLSLLNKPESVLYNGQNRFFTRKMQEGFSFRIAKRSSGNNFTQN